MNERPRLAPRTLPTIPLLLALALLATGAGFGQPSTPAAEPRFDPTLFQGMKWRNIGPFRGGRSVASTGVRADRDTFYFGGVGSGVWKTSDRGETWTNVSDKTFGTSSVGAIAVSHSDPNVVFVGMGEHAVRGVATSHGDGVYKSTDAGKTWSHLGLERSRQISAVIIHPTNPDWVWVAAQGAPYGPSEDRGVYRSKDGGATWEKVLYVDRNAGPSSLAIDPNNPRVLFAGFWDHLRLGWQVRSGGPGSGIWKTTDGGDHWEKIGTDPKTGFPKTIGKTSVAVSADPQRIYALIEADPGGGLYRSEDGGKTWKVINEEWGIRARAWYYIKVFADPSNPDTVWITNAQLYRSIDGGKTFATVRVPHGDNHHLWFHPDDPELMINSNDGGANVSANGGRSWSTQQNQPTGQFYRVSTDLQYPYHVYGGQQDNSAIGIVSQAPGGIGWEDFYSLGGCESAHVAFDPKDPELVYAGCYMGIMEEWQRSNRATRDVMAYPMMPAAMASRDMKYRFNWNAPIVASPQDPKVLYHAGNVLLRTSDRGRSWTEISPDLTRDDDEKQGPGGGPITNEGAGGEIYGTIFAVAPSPHDAGTIWTGSDDGLVHITRDAGAAWSNVTPKGLEEAIINSIEVSPHDPAKAYVAVSRYKFNDFVPLAYKTTDYGKTWQKITTGIAAEAWVRVVREDPVRRGLLYAGTEAGPYVSFDDGGSWQSLALNLPVTPITDLAIQGPSNDLVAATQGRGFWILDNLSPLQQLDDEVGKASAHLFAPEPAIRSAFGGGGPPGGRPRVGQNPAGATFLDFAVLALPPEGQTVALEIVDSAGAVVRRFESKEVEPSASSEGGDPAQEPAKDAAKDKKKDPFELAEEATITRFDLAKGMNRVPWDSRRASVEPVPGLFVFGSLDGRKVVPGDYQVRLVAGEVTATQPLRVLPDPRFEATLADYRTQEELAAQVDTELAEIHRAVLQIRAVRDQVQAFLGRLGDGNETLAESGRDLVKRLTTQEDRLIQKRTVDGQTVINFPVQLNHHYVILRGSIDQAEGIVNAGARQRFADLQAQWQGYRADIETLLGPDVEAFNRQAAEAAVPAVRLRP